MNPICTGLVGFGLSGHKLISPFLHSSELFDLKTVIQSQRTTAKEIYPDVNVSHDYASLINDPKIELIIITSPNIFHFDQAWQALEANKHVIIEKPITPTSSEAEKLISLASKKNKVLSVFHNRRWDGNFMTVKKVIEAGLLGDILDYEAHFDRYDPELKPESWRNKLNAGSGVLYDLGPHLIDQAIQLFGLPQGVYADIRSQRKNSPVDDYFELQLIYPQTKVTLKAGKFLREPGPHYAVHGRRGSFIKYGCDPQGDQLIKGISPIEADFGSEEIKHWGLLNTKVNGIRFHGRIETETGRWMNYFENIYEAINKHASLQVSAEDGRNTINIIEKAFESHQKKCIVNLE